MKLVFVLGLEEELNLLDFDHQKNIQDEMYHIVLIHRHYQYILYMYNLSHLHLVSNQNIIEKVFDHMVGSLVKEFQLVTKFQPTLNLVES